MAASSSALAPSYSGSAGCDKDLEIGRLKCTLLRVNVIVEGLVRRKQTAYVDSLPFRTEFYAETESKSGDWNNGVTNLVSRVDWELLFELIVQTATRNTEHCVRLQAVSIMNVIVMKANAFMEREKFSRTLVFEIIAELLAKKTGFERRNQAVQLLYMLLNCPKIMVKFFTGYEEEKNGGAMDEDAMSFQKYCMIFPGLADCLACSEHNQEDIADTGGPDIAQQIGVQPFIFCNCLVCVNNSSDMATLAIDVASRLSRKDQIYEKFDSRPESDIGDLARVFKKRVFCDNIS